MGLTKYKLGELIEQCDNRNSDESLTVDCVRGISTSKEFIETKANMDGVSVKSYKIVNEDEFAYVADTSRRGDKIAIAYNSNKEKMLISSIYTVFFVKRKDLLLSDYLFMYFNRPEFDRFSRFNSWGSARETFNWEDMCDIDIELPNIDIQQKYVDVYNAMLENQKSYERGLDDLRLICDGHFDKVKKERTISLGEIIEKVDRRNIGGTYRENDVRGITNKKQFEDTKADLLGTDLSKFIVVQKNEFAYNSRTDGRDMLVLALNRDEKPVIVTWNYNAFKIKNLYSKKVNPEYLYAYFKRSEFDRRVRFDSWGSSQELLSWESLCNIKIPFPDIRVQNSIAEINSVYVERKVINEKLKAQIKDICPILIKGSIEEATKVKEA